MATTYQKADLDVLQTVAWMMRKHHQRLHEAGVQVGVLMASNEDGPAVKHAGYPAVATIKVVSLKDRLTKGYDAELLIDEKEYGDFNDAHRQALCDHELCHLELIQVPPKQLARLRHDDPQAPDWKLDDLGRPRLKLRPGDRNAGDGFAEVIARHGAAALEYHAYISAKLWADASRAVGVA